MIRFFCLRLNYLAKNLIDFFCSGKWPHSRSRESSLTLLGIIDQHKVSYQSLFYLTCQPHLTQLITPFILRLPFTSNIPRSPGFPHSSLATHSQCFLMVAPYFYNLSKVELPGSCPWTSCLCLSHIWCYGFKHHVYHSFSP